jgi:hypothetical protein
MRNEIIYIYIKVNYGHFMWKKKSYEDMKFYISFYDIIL